MLLNGLEETYTQYIIGGFVLLLIFIICCLIHNKLLRES